MKKIFFLLLLMNALFLIPSYGAGVKSMKKQEKVRFQPTPNPIETKGEKVMININGAYPPKYFKKNAIVVFQPVFQWDGGSIDLIPIVLRGEKIKGESTMIPYKKGGRFNYTDVIDYLPGMETGKIIVNPVAYKGKQVSEEVKFRQDALKQKGAVELGNIQIADKINITSTRVSTKGDISIAPNAYKKTEGISMSALVFFPVNLASVNWDFSLNKTYESKNQVEKLKSYMLANSIPTQISISGWASPEGEERFNINLSKKRAEGAVGLVNKMIDEVLYVKAQQENIDPKDVDYYVAMEKKDILITTNAFGEDWENFLTLVEQSDIPEKNAIANVVKSQTNLNKREQEIRNMSVIFKELAAQILPNLRRSLITFSYTVPKRTDQEIGKLAALSPEKLTFDELMYAAYLNYNYASKYKLYKWATENYSSEWSSWNNAAAVCLYMGNLTEAERYLNVAKEMNAEDPHVLNNLALLYIEKKDYETAKAYLDKAIDMGNAEAEQNIAVLELKTGNYEEANTILENKECSYNLAFTQLMSGNTGNAIKTLDCCIQQNAEVFYLKAICFARLDDMQETLDNLKSACGQDDTYKSIAEKDVEFRKLWNVVEFQEIVK